jgi:hypothetical protein
MSGTVYDLLRNPVREMRLSSRASGRYSIHYIYMVKRVLIQNTSSGVACELSITELAGYLTKRNGVSGRLFAC